MFCIRQYLSQKKKRKKREKIGWPTLCVPGWVVEAKYWLSVFVKKKRRKEKRLKIEFSFYLESYMYMNKKSRILVCYFLVSCHSRVGPVSQTAIFEFLIFAFWFIFDFLIFFFFTLVQQILPKAYAINCPYFATGTQSNVYEITDKKNGISKLCKNCSA